MAWLLGGWAGRAGGDNISNERVLEESAGPCLGCWEVGAGSSKFVCLTQRCTLPVLPRPAGEVQWVKQNIQRYNQRAKDKGVRVVSCCGYDRCAGLWV